MNTINPNEPMEQIPVPSGLLACLLLIPLRGQETRQKQAGIPHRGRSMKNMHLLSTLLGLAIVPWNLALGNIVAIDGERRPIEMTSEQVTVDVAPAHSLVTGRYSFRQTPDDWAFQGDKYVLIYLPVLLAEKDIDTYGKRYQAPVVAVGSHAFTATPAAARDLIGRPGPVRLPKGWEIRLYQAKIPLSLIGKQFTVAARYVQPNFPNDVAAYIPFFPPHDVDLATVSFIAPAGYGLSKVGLPSLVSRPATRLDFQPFDRKLIAVRLKTK